MRFWIAALGLALFLAGTPGAAASLASPEQEKALTAACHVWLQGLDVNATATYASVDGGLCINGTIDEGLDKSFFDRLKVIDPARPIVVVVRSGGGEADSSMNIAEALQARPVTVVADTLCASSCADFLILAGQRRVILPDTLLLYHGGVTLETLNQAAPQLRERAQKDPRIDYARAMEQIRERTNRQIARQEAFLVKAGVSTILFRWMDLINHMTPEEQAEHCAPDTSIIQYPPEVLARFKVRFDSDGAPRSQAAVDSLVRKLGKDARICYWKEPV